MTPTHEVMMAKTEPAASDHIRIGISQLWPDRIVN